MGQKVSPTGLRIGINKDWESKWFNLKEMPDFIEEDRRIRTYLKEKLNNNFKYKEKKCRKNSD